MFDGLLNGLGIGVWVQGLPAALQPGVVRAGFVAVHRCSAWLQYVAALCGVDMLTLVERMMSMQNTSDGLPACHIDLELCCLREYIFMTCQT